MEEQSITRAMARGAAIGAGILTFFGTYWAFAALINWPQAPAWVYGILTLVTVALTGFSVARFIAAAKRWPAPDAAQGARQGRAAGKWFALIFGVEVIAIAVAAIGLARANRPLLIPVVIAAIVGLHFLPLARVFHIPLYSITGLLVLVCVAASLLIANANMRLLALGLAVALVLWGSAVAVLLNYTRSTPTASRQSENKVP